VEYRKSEEENLLQVAEIPGATGGQRGRNGTIHATNHNSHEKSEFTRQNPMAVLLEKTSSRNLKKILKNIFRA